MDVVDAIDRLTVVHREPKFGAPFSTVINSAFAIEHRQIAPAASIARTSFFAQSACDPHIAPHASRFNEFGFWSYQALAVEAARLRHVTLAGTDGVVLVDGCVIPETVSHIMTWSAGSSVKSYENKHRIEFHADRPVRFLPPSETYFVGFTASWRNYAHWLQETLPKLVTYAAMVRDEPRIKLIVPRFEPGSFQQQTLDLLGIVPDSVVTIGHDECFGLDACWITNNADIWSVPPFVSVSACELAAKVERPRSTEMARFERVYVHRREPTRNVANYDALRVVLDRYGFTVVSFDTMKLADQIAIMRAARFVVAEHGAGLANLLFCEPGAQVLELFNPACVQPAFWSLASVCGLGFGYLVGAHVSTAQSAKPDWNTPYRIPPDVFEAAIRNMPGIGASFAPMQPLPAEPDAVPLPFVRPSVVFTAPDLLDVGEVKFALAGSQGRAAPDRVLVHKDRGFIDSYVETFATIDARRALGFGIHDGGTSIFMTVLLGLQKFVCVDASASVPGFADLLARTGLGARIKPYHGVAQDNAGSVRAILEREFGAEPPDLMIDDASHLYELTKQSFQIAFPYLADGGHYMIENWSWAHWPENQDGGHGWSDRPAMTNLILELVLLLPSSDMIEWISIRQPFVVIKKRASRHGAALLDIDATLRTRGRRLGMI